MVYDKSLESSNVPYTVKVDAQKLGQLMEELGIPNEEISRTKFTIKRSLFGGAIGMMNGVTGDIAIGIDHFWKLRARAEERASQIANHRKAPREEDFREILYTKRLAHYLAAAPPEKGVDFAKKLIERGVVRKMGSSVIHETQHRADKKNLLLQAKRLLLYLGTTGVGVVSSLSMLMLINKEMEVYLNSMPPEAKILSQLAMPTFQVILTLFYVNAAYLIDPAELSAQAAEKEKRNLPIWRNLIIVDPKPQEAIA